MTVTVAGAGMAGLVAAARLRQLGREVTVREKGTRPGGSMLLSSGVIWRHRTLDAFRAECPGGDAALQQLIYDQLDDRLDWLESLGVTAVESATGNPLTVGRRHDPRLLVPVLLRHAGDVLLAQSTEAAPGEPLVLATGGFGAALARQLSLPLRANPWSEGDGLVLARERGAATSQGMDEFYGRALPVTPSELPEEAWVRLGQVYGRHALVLDELGAAVDIGHPAWHENDLVQEIARRPGGRAWFLVADEALDQPVRDTTVAERIEAARMAGGTVVDPGKLSFLGAVRLPVRGARDGNRHAHDRRSHRRPGGPRVG